MAVVIIIMAILSLIIGFSINSSFMNRYGTWAVNIPWCIAQSVCVFFLIVYVFSASTRTTDSGPMYFWIMATIVSYIFGIRGCIRQASGIRGAESETATAVIAQVIIPIGSALFVLILLSALAGNDRRRRRRR